jgi:hypothetical protein
VSQQGECSVKNFFRDSCDPRRRRADRNQDFDAGLSSLVCQENVTPLDVSAFLDELEKLCRKLGIETKVGDDQRCTASTSRWLPTGRYGGRRALTQSELSLALKAVAASAAAGAVRRSPRAWHAWLMRSGSFWACYCSPTTKSLSEARQALVQS